MAKPQRVTCFVTNLEDRPGSLLKVMAELKAKKVSLAGLWGFTTGPGNAQLYSAAKSPAKLRDSLSAAGWLAEEKTAFYVKGTDRVGALLQTLQVLADAGVNIDAIDAIAVGKSFGSYIWVNNADVERAAKALGAK